MWRKHNALELATPEAFRKDPGLVWQFYSLRRHKALTSSPNAAHYALAELARKRPPPEFLTLTQNVDGLSEAAGHVNCPLSDPLKSIEYLHGSLYHVRCARVWCRYSRFDISDPIVPSLLVPSEGLDGDEASWTSDVELPRCPQCKTGLLRPGVVWFGEELDSQMLKRIQQYIERDPVDLCIVIGTSGTVYPAAGYANLVKAQGGKVAIVDIDCSVRGNADWLFEGDAAKLIPEMLEPIIGKIEVPPERPTVKECLEKQAKEKEEEAAAAAVVTRTWK